MKGLKLYQKSVYLCEYTAQVLKTDGDKVYFEDTIFFPEGGGQSCDIGTINEFAVTDVQEEGDDIYHLVPGHNLKAGDNCTLKIDWPRRFDNMQRHLGEHLLSGMIHRAFGGVNRGFHMSDEYMTADFSMEDNPEYKTLTWDMVLTAEDMTNQAIWANLPVRIDYFETRSEAEKMPLRKALAFDKDITIVTAGDLNDPADCCACCAPHLSNTAQVGLFKAFKVEKNKSMFRVYFDAGQRAMKDYRQKDDMITALCNRYSCGFENLEKKIAADETKHQELAVAHATLRDSVIKMRLEEINNTFEQVRSGENPNKTLSIFSYDDLTLDDVQHIGQKLENIPGLAVLRHSPTHTALLFSSGDCQCGKLVKDNANVFNGKGGGRDTSSRAVFPCDEDMDNYLTAIKNLI